MDRPLKTPISATTSAFATAFRRLDEKRFTGHALWREAPYLHFVVEILVDGEPVGLVRAENYSAELANGKEPASDHGFVYIARKQQLAGSHQIEARIANLAVPIGTPIDLKRQQVGQASIDSPGRVDWLGGLRVAGMVAIRETPSSICQIRVHENGVLIAQTNARRWIAASEAREDLASAHFDLQLPATFADGRAHQLTVTDQSGRELDGSPVLMIAFPDALTQLVKGEPDLAREHTRAEWFDRFLPMSVPFENYVEWKERFPSPPVALKTELPVRVVVVGSDGSEDALARLAEHKYGNWSATVLASAADGSFGWKQLHEAITADTPDDSIAVFLRPPITLRDDAIARLVQGLIDTPDAAASYGDIENISHNGTLEPLFFGAFDYERMLEQGYAAALFAIRTSRVIHPTAEKHGTLARLLLGLCDTGSMQAGNLIVHVPGLLATTSKETPLPSQAEIQAASSAHLGSRKIKAQIHSVRGTTQPAVRIRRRHTAASLVSVIIPTRDRTDLLEPCIDSLVSKTTKANLEIVIVDNGSCAPETLSFLKARQRKGDRVVDAPGPFNYSHLNNVGVAAAKGEIICLLNNDTEVLDPDWLDELLSRLSDPTVGAVAPKLIWPNRMVQHGGIVLGPNFAASDAFNDCLDVDPGYGDLLRVAHEATALSGACMLVRRRDYVAVNGFDEIAFPVLFNDVDFCLKLRALGKRNVFTPHTSLLHRESATRQRDTSYSQKSRFQRELKLLRTRWGDVLANDPLYSPYLNLDPYPYSALAWPPRPSSSRLNVVPKPKSTSAH